MKRGMYAGLAVCFLSLFIAASQAEIATLSRDSPRLAGSMHRRPDASADRFPRRRVFDSFASYRIRRIECPITVSFDTASEISIPSCSAGYALREDSQRKRKAFAFSFYRHRATGFRTVECQREDCLNVQLECTQPAGRRTQSLRY